ncbi:hypothetical protein QQS21_007865 [Conoideocrella luteorostrata]|uniref:Up-regulated during septation protein 1 domain-containing protein n=1 Tax=Conoideocrella luteorostrata TaxID=1105319 RepID=A0AAJ0CP98_9HYPO|nr:hypothetical protein QQS21_007865 [Conoideocrella luteorostrata]
MAHIADCVAVPKSGPSLEISLGGPLTASTVALTSTIETQAPLTMELARRHKYCLFPQNRQFSNLGNDSSWHQERNHTVVSKDRRDSTKFSESDLLFEPTRNNAGAHFENTMPVTGNVTDHQKIGSTFSSEAELQSSPRCVRFAVDGGDANNGVQASTLDDGRCTNLDEECTRCTGDTFSSPSLQPCGVRPFPMQTETTNFSSTGPWTTRLERLSGSNYDASSRDTPHKPLDPQQREVQIHEGPVLETLTLSRDPREPREQVVDRDHCHDGAPAETAANPTSDCRSREYGILPKGWTPSKAARRFPDNDVNFLRKQALGQAETFEVLPVSDVRALSKELRELDGNAELQREKLMSLRFRRLQLHSQILRKLRLRKKVKYGYEALLRHEEVLARVDLRIDSWLTCQERTENRRIRIRQKLLEHLAAAILLPAERGQSSISESIRHFRAFDRWRELPELPTTLEGR